MFAGLTPYPQEIKLAGIILLGGVIFAAGMHFGALSPRAELATYKAQDLQGQLAASQTALAAVQAQLSQAKLVTANNSSVIQGLTDANAKISAGWASDRALAQRLLNNAKTLPASGPAVPQAGSGPPTPPASGAPGDDSLADALASASTECERNAARLDALSAQIGPQL